MMWTFLCGAVALVLTGLWARFRIINRHALRLCRAIPSPQPCYPIVGNALLFVCSIEEMTERIRQIIEECVLNGHRAVCVWIGAYPFIVIIHPDDVKVLLNNSLGRGYEIEESGKEFMKYGLLTSPVDHWKITRRHLNLSFHPLNLEELLSTFNFTSRQLVADLSGHVDGTEFDLMPLVMSAALSSICTFLFGPDTVEKVNTEVFNDLRHAVELAAELLSLRIYRPWLYIDFVFKMLYGKEINSVKTSFRKILKIADTSSVKSNEAGDSDPEKDKTKCDFQSILGAMRELQLRVSSVTDRKIMDEMGSFFATGTDTIGVTVSSCLLALASFPPIQDKVYEEICSVVSEDDEEDVTHLDLKRLTYLEQVIKETLRFFIVVPFTSRAPNRDIDLGGYTIPANNLTGVCVSSVCIDPKYFPDPYKFDPNRFSTASSADDVFIPFSRGPRNCIGKAYSMMLIKVMVARVVRKYKLSTNMDIGNLKMKYMITLTCCDGYRVSLSNRK